MRAARMSWQEHMAVAGIIEQVAAWPIGARVQLYFFYIPHLPAFVGGENTGTGPCTTEIMNYMLVRNDEIIMKDLVYCDDGHITHISGERWHIYKGDDLTRLRKFVKEWTSKKSEKGLKPSGQEAMLPLKKSTES